MVYDVVDIYDSFVMGLGKVEDIVNVVFFEYFMEGVFVFFGEFDDFNVDFGFGFGFEVFFDFGIGSIKFVVKRSKVVYNGGKLVFV